jgi:hypothetical protein
MIFIILEGNASGPFFITIPKTGSGESLSVARDEEVTPSIPQEFCFCSVGDFL